MPILEDIRRHSLEPALRRLEIVETVSKGSETHKVGRIRQTKNQLFCIPDTPLGIHMSVHDADRTHPVGRIHQRIPAGKGAFWVYPPGSEIGSTIGQVDIPPFSQIQGALPLPPQSGLGQISVNSLWQQTQTLRRPPKETTVDCDVSLAEAFGIAYFFIRPGDVSPLVRWFDDRQNSYAGVNLTAHIFDVFAPWLAVVFFKSHFKR